MHDSIRHSLTTEDTSRKVGSKTKAQLRTAPHHAKLLRQFECDRAWAFPSPCHGPNNAIWTINGCDRRDRKTQEAHQDLRATPVKCCANDSECRHRVLYNQPFQSIKRMTCRYLGIDIKSQKHSALASTTNV